MVRTPEIRHFEIANSFESAHWPWPWKICFLALLKSCTFWDTTFLYVDDDMLFLGQAYAWACRDLRTLHIEYPTVLLRFCLGYITVVYVIMSMFVGVMPLLELRILEMHSFRHYSPSCFDILSWKDYFRVKMHSLLLRPGSDNSISLWCKLCHTIDLSNYRSWFPFWDDCFIWLKFLFFIFLKPAHNLFVNGIIPSLLLP